MSYETDLGKVKGLGSSKHGFGHWWMQRMSAILLVPTGLYVLFSLAQLDVFNAAAVVAWLSSPLNAAITLLFAVTGSYHGALGIQVVLEDYVHNHAINLILQYLTKILMIVMIMATVYAIASILLG
ncbi:succinate dehydrogenase, hydrophobic membrane anchor protein [Marinicella sp. S1101]|uniref:succinate dehydrogenase, hydrophobic membrane anchor protein n=1 Tax=Marinicella marina TaxID=2996016 RepID=UPI0022609C63|nr:succinate dehydrogenase, hydrophobic membrane anchor protein [Marinicella marina]MCX7554460.1 succinate dehydrogenase, hydrophobic membrane anchor protein [Marinicella marina]MDJ1140611.1 succinate dehydrogenase, hydrophobic membrane anchor protein [Marinicella marina]